MQTDHAIAELGPKAILGTFLSLNPILLRPNPPENIQQYHLNSCADHGGMIRSCIACIPAEASAIKLEIVSDEQIWSADML